MSFSAIAQMISGQKQFFLYAFKRGSIEYLFNSTSSVITKTVGGITGTSWSASAISHDRIPDSSESFRSQFPIVFPLTDSFAETFIGGLSLDIVSVKIWRGFVNDLDQELVVCYSGKVIGHQASDDGTITLQCMTLLADLQRRGLSAVMQRPCNRTLYGRGCNVNIAAYELPGTVLAVSANEFVITVNSADDFANGYYNGGIITFAGRREMIVGHSGQNLTLAARIPGLAVSSSVNIAPGCNLTEAMCISRFSNIVNFGGFSYILDTPFDGRSIV